LITANTAEEMRTAVLREIENATIFIATAAVADYRPKQQSENKIKKDASELTLELERTPDILSEVASQRRPIQLLVGFAAETEDVTANAQRKLHAKNLDIVVANDVSGESSGFDSDLNAVTILVRDNPAIDVPLTSKLDVANRILDEVAKMRRDGPIEMESDIGKR
jgi:phosphopantothenoylcysteine decarboxylase/phosphopantothenate--cysteine ligase